MHDTMPNHNGQQLKTTAYTRLQPQCKKRNVQSYLWVKPTKAQYMKQNMTQCESAMCHDLQPRPTLHNNHNTRSRMHNHTFGRKMRTQHSNKKMQLTKCTTIRIKNPIRPYLWIAPTIAQYMTQYVTQCKTAKSQKFATTANTT